MEHTGKLTSFLREYRAILTAAGSIILTWLSERAFSIIDSSLFSGIPLFLCYLILFAAWAVIIAVVIVLYRIFSGNPLDAGDTKRIIRQSGACFMLSNQQQMYEYDERNDNILSLENKKKRKNILYYSLSAKPYLNWIDYVYFIYLRTLRDNLKCKLIISLHFPDSIKECKLQNLDVNPLKLRNDYYQICKVFESNARKILGNNVTFYREDQFYRENKRKYAEDFRILWDTFVLYFAKEMEDSEAETYTDFKRRLSHMASAFPIWMLAEKYKRERLYVLDNRKSFEIWEYSPLDAVRNKDDLYFIITNKITTDSGKKVDVHNINNVINLTDTPEIIREKLSRLSEDKELVKLMTRFLSADERLPVHLKSRLAMDGDTSELLGEIVMTIRETYQFTAMPGDEGGVSVADRT